MPQLTSSVLGGQSQLVILLLINIIFLIVGMFIDPGSAVIVFSPLIYTTALAAGIDPIQRAGGAERVHRHGDARPWA